MPGSLKTRVGLVPEESREGVEMELDLKDCIGKIRKVCPGMESGQKNKLSCFCSPYRAVEKVN